MPDQLAPAAYFDHITLLTGSQSTNWPLICRANLDCEEHERNLGDFGRYANLVGPEPVLEICPSPSRPGGWRRLGADRANSR